ncbi:hypothetical protein LCGC14_1080120 [marine sediment metagenome]|uniref:Uncharacterized protein n=1 Tax=marine sediment metagenome TaxID=412755 RepID=A0A0F9MK84_9ZZZZ
MNNEEAEAYKAQESLQAQGIEGQQAPYLPQIHEQVQQAQAILVEQTNPNKIVEAIMLRLRGMKKNPDGSETKVGEPKMNEKGIKEIWFKLDSFINQNIILSHVDNKEITNIMNAVSRTLVLDLQLNWREYGITKKTDLDAINDTVLINIYMALKRAEGQGEKNWLSKISVENISSVPRMSMNKKEGFWNKFRL